MLINYLIISFFGRETTEELNRLSANSGNLSKSTTSLLLSLTLSSIS